MNAKYFVLKKTMKIGSTEYKHGESYDVKSALLPTLLVLESNGICTFYAEKFAKTIEVKATQVQKPSKKKANKDVEL